MSRTTIQIEEETRERLKALKIVKGESYNDLLNRILDICEKEGVDLKKL